MGAGEGDEARGRLYAIAIAECRGARSKGGVSAWRGAHWPGGECGEVKESRHARRGRGRRE